jgi:hypothetical protein
MSTGSAIRALFCIGVLPAFFDAGPEERQAAMDAIPPAFDDLRGRFGVQVLGTLDDDVTMVGPSAGFPWTSYILADVPDLGAIREVCNVLRTTHVGSHRLWRYLRIEARVGRELFFGTR